MLVDDKVCKKRTRYDGGRELEPKQLALSARLRARSKCHFSFLRSQGLELKKNIIFERACAATGPQVARAEQKISWACLTPKI